MTDSAANRSPALLLKTRTPEPSGMRLVRQVSPGLRVRLPQEPASVWHCTVMDEPVGLWT